MQSLYDYDLKRFGGLYAHGDCQTREQMKDVWINCFQPPVESTMLSV